MSVYVHEEWYPISPSKATFASCDTVPGSRSTPFDRAPSGRRHRSRRAHCPEIVRGGPVIKKMNSAYRSQPIKSALRGESWGDVAKLMRLVPLTAQDRSAIARDLRPVLVLTTPLAELREDRAGR